MFEEASRADKRVSELASRAVCCQCAVGLSIDSRILSVSPIAPLAVQVCDMLT